MEYSTRTNIKAVIQSHCFTGANRLFYRKKINGVSRVVYKTGQLRRPYVVTGYKSLWQAAHGLKDAINVGLDEQVLYDGEACEDYLMKEA